MGVDLPALKQRTEKTLMSKEVNLIKTKTKKKKCLSLKGRAKILPLL